MAGPEASGGPARGDPDPGGLQQRRVVGSAGKRGPQCRGTVRGRERSRRVGGAERSTTKPLEIAYLSFAVANSYDAPMLAAAQGVAAADNAKLTVFDANLDPAAQTKQLQDAAASGKFDAIITQPLYGAGMVQDVTNAINSGIAVGNIDQILGADNTTAESQVQGLSANVAFVPSTLGKKIGDLVVKACAEKRQPMQRRLHLVGQGGRPRPALRKAFDEAIAATRRSRSWPRASRSTRPRSGSRPPRTCSRRTRT